MMLGTTVSRTLAMTVPQIHIDHVKNLASLSGDIECPCEDKSLCRPNYQPRGSPGAVREKEVFGFVGDGGAGFAEYDWDVVSTIAWGTNTDLICQAHSHGARVVMSAPSFGQNGSDFPETQFERDTWINNTLRAAVAGHYDGLTFDYESPIAATDTKKMGLYIALVQQTTAKFHEHISGSQVSVCVAWSPDDIDGRAYDYSGLSKASDLLYLMVYDTRSQVFDQCLASANAPTPVVDRAIQRYSDIGIPPDKMILGLPWYAYDYPCLPGMQPTDRFCPIKLVPFRGVNCSDAAGGEIPYSYVMQLLENNATLSRQWDSSMGTPYFNYRNTGDGIVHQVWFDDAESLALKYAKARDAGLKGTGPYTFSDLDYSSSASRQQSAEMWKALHVFADGS